MAQPEEAPPPEKPWVILASVPGVVDAPYLGKGRDISVDVKKPPRVSVLKVARGLIPDNPVVRYPYIAAADPSGRRLLLCTSHLSDRWHHMTPGDNERRQILDLDNKRGAYFLCDTATLTTIRLPERTTFPDSVEPDGPILHSGNIGVIRRDDGQFMVAELQPMASVSDATLLCHLAGADTWVRKKLSYFPDYPNWGWGNNGVISHDGQLWWVDLSYGLLACDPFDEQPDLLYVPLPEGCVVPFANRIPDALLDLDKTRCVRVSDGKLRYVQIDHAGANLICMWTMTLDDPDGMEWTQQYVAPFAAIWEDESYRETGLRHEVPVIALVHPWNPDEVYFWQDKLIFAVDVPKRKVLSCDYIDLALAPDLPMPVRELPSSRLVQAWELPLTLLPDHDGSGGCSSSQTDSGQASSASSSAVVG